VVAAALAELVVDSSWCGRRASSCIMVTLAFAQMFFFLFHDTNFGGG